MKKKIKMFMVILISTTVATKSTDIEIEILYSSEIEKNKEDFTWQLLLVV